MPVIIASREQVISTNLMKTMINKTQSENKYRISGKGDRSINHVLYAVSWQKTVGADLTVGKSEYCDVRQFVVSK